MNVQIFGSAKSFDTKKAERWFKERRIKYQYVDLPRYGLGRRELESVRTAVGAENLLDEKAKGAELVKYLARPEDRLEKLLEQPELLRTPIVRNGTRMTVGYQPEVWDSWIRADS